MTKQIILRFIKISNQCNTALAITSAIRRTYQKKKFCQELGFDSLQQYVGKQNFVTYLK